MTNRAIAEYLVSDKRFDIHLPQAPSVRIVLMFPSATFVQREASMSNVSVAGGGLSDAMTAMRI
jgi:hypothetical protein